MKKYHCQSFLSLLLLLGLFSCNHKPNLNGDLALTYTNIVDVRNGEIIPNQDIVIVDKQIAHIVQTNKYPLKADSLIDGNGLYIIPGLWDMHVHVRQFEQTFFPLFIAHGVTGIRDMFNPVIDEIGAWKDSVNQAVGLTPRVGLVAGRLVDGPKGRNWPGSIVLDGVDSVREKVIEVAQAKGYDFIKVYGALSASQLEAISDKAQEVGLTIAGHLPMEVPLKQAIVLGQKSIEHLQGFHIAMSTGNDSLLAEIKNVRESKGGWASVLAYWQGEALATQQRDSTKVKEIMSLLKEKGVYPCTSVFYMSHQRINNPHETIDPELFGFYYYPYSLLEQYTRQLKQSNSPELRDQFKLTYTGNLQLIRDFERYEVPFLAGTDASPTRPVLPGRSLHRELQLMQESGVKPATILKSATIYPAQFMQAEDKYGTVEEGKMADLVLLNQNPLNDIAHAQKINAVILKGEFYSKKQLEVALQTIRKKAVR
ncbi:MAG: amidohydrolase family protein [Desulfobulbaceae bacterium]